jgi:hypothetical protein
MNALFLEESARKLIRRAPIVHSRFAASSTNADSRQLIDSISSWDIMPYRPYDRPRGAPMQPRVKITDVAIWFKHIEGPNLPEGDEDVSDDLASATSFFPEWESPEDEEAFGDL